MPWEEPARHQEAEADGSDHAQRRHQQRRTTHGEQLPDLRGEPHFEEQEEHADLRQQLEPRELAHPVESVPAQQAEVADDDPREQLAQNGRLAELLRQRAAQPGAEEHHHQREQQGRQVRATARGEGATGQQEDREYHGRRDQTGTGHHERNFIAQMRLQVERNQRR
jgi:hypothetical protein